MSDGTPLNVGTAGDDVYTEDITADASAPRPPGATALKIQGVKHYVGMRGALGKPVSARDPMPVRDRRAAALLEELSDQADELLASLGGLGAVLGVVNGFLVVSAGIAIQFGDNGPTIEAGAGVPTRTDRRDSSLWMRTDPPDATHAHYVSIGGVWTALT